MKCAVVPAPGAQIELREVPVPEPGPDEALVKVFACGVCHTDLTLADGSHDVARFPLIPGHEVAGMVTKLGSRADWPPVGTRVGQPWLFSSCGRCGYCLRGDAVYCRGQDATGATVPGGYQEFMISKARQLVTLPPSIAPADAAPLLCAGLTAFTGIGKSGCGPGGRLAVLGLGGLGQYAACFAGAMGIRVAVVSGSQDKRATALSLGAELFVDRQAGDFTNALRDWEGGADVIISTVPDCTTIASAPRGLVPGGTLVILGVGWDSLRLDCKDLVERGITVLGTPSGSVKDACRSLAFAHQLTSLPQVTKMPFHQVRDALELARSQHAAHRVVLTMETSWPPTETPDLGEPLLSGSPERRT